MPRLDTTVYFFDRSDSGLFLIGREQPVSVDVKVQQKNMKIVYFSYSIRFHLQYVFIMSKRVYIRAILAAYLLEEDNIEIIEEEQKRSRIWVKDWVKERETQGFCMKLMVQLREEEPLLYHNFVRMTAEQFDHVLGLVTPHIQKSDTLLRKSISPLSRLALTLRFLATGESFRSLQFLFRIPQPTISTIIPEVLDAIYTVLVGDYLQVSPKHSEHSLQCTMYIAHELLLFEIKRL